MTVGTLFSDLLGLAKCIFLKKTQTTKQPDSGSLGTSYGKDLAINVGAIIQTFEQRVVE